MDEAAQSRVRARHCRALAQIATSRYVADELLRVAEQFDADAAQAEIRRKLALQRNRYATKEDPVQTGVVASSNSLPSRRG